MIQTSVFKKYGFDTESLKTLFTAKKPSDKINNLVDLIRERIKDGRTRALSNYRIWAAIDLAYDAPFHQETPTLIRHILDRNNSADEIRKAVNSWGLCEGSLFCKTKGDDGKDILELNVPVFFEILVPVVRAYLSVRLSKIFNDRNLDPLFKYEPRHYTELNRIRCEIITDIVETMSVQYGYANNLKQVIFNALLYSVALEFPCEPWNSEKQEGEDGKDHVVREGIPYVQPHITRIFYDLQYGLSTFNTDTGNTFAGYWAVMRAGDVLSKDKYWNTKNVAYGFNWLDKGSAYANYFEQVYPCTMELPKVGASAKETDREKNQATYTTNDYDRALFVTYIFMKLVPDDWGMEGEVQDGKKKKMKGYKNPVWFRFIIGSDDTVLYAEPYPYCPVTYAGYDPDQNRSKNASLGLEIVPWQDLLGNTLTQTVLTIKRNLANIIFYDTNMDVEGQVNEIKRRTQWQYNNINLIGYDSLKAHRSGTDPRTAFHEVKFAYADTSQMIQSITMYLSIMERMLGISAQEIGSAASHQQGNKEIELINSSSSNRVTYTASGIDDYIDAKKRQLHHANLAYRDEDVEAEISADIENVDKHLKDLGFKVTGRTKNGIVIKGKKKPLKDLSIENIASQRDGPDRFKDAAVGQAMYVALQSINQNPALVQIIEPSSLAEMYELAAKFTGADKDFKIKLNKDGVMSNQLQQLVQQIQQQIKQEVEQSVAKDIAKPAAEAVQEIEQKNAEQDNQLLQMSQVVESQKQQLEQLQAQLQQIMSLATTAPPLQPPQTIDANYPQPIAAAPAGIVG